MTEPHPLLAELADIVEAGQAPATGIAAGWWLLSLLALLAAVLVVWLASKRRLQQQQQAALVAARHELQQLSQQKEPNAASINQLLKRLIRHYAPHSALLGCPVAEWQAFLQQQCPGDWPDLTTLLYQQTPEPELAQRFAKLANTWLAQQTAEQLQQLDGGPHG